MAAAYNGNPALRSRAASARLLLNGTPHMPSKAFELPVLTNGCRTAGMRANRSYPIEQQCEVALMNPTSKDGQKQFLKDVKRILQKTETGTLLYAGSDIMERVYQRVLGLLSNHPAWKTRKGSLIDIRVRPVGVTEGPMRQKNKHRPGWSIVLYYTDGSTWVPQTDMLFGDVNVVNELSKVCRAIGKPRLDAFYNQWCDDFLMNKAADPNYIQYCPLSLTMPNKRGEITRIAIDPDGKEDLHVDHIDPTHAQIVVAWVLSQVKGMPAAGTTFDMLALSTAVRAHRDSIAKFILTLAFSPGHNAFLSTVLTKSFEAFHDAHCVDNLQVASARKNTEKNGPRALSMLTAAVDEYVSTHPNADPLNRMNADGVRLRMQRRQAAEAKKRARMRVGPDDPDKRQRGKHGVHNAGRGRGGEVRWDDAWSDSDTDEYDE